MTKFSSMLITLPVIILPIAALAPKPAAAQMVQPIEAVEILAKSEAASAKCRILQRSEQAELKEYAARAEIATAQRLGSDEAHAAVAAGRAQGKAAGCSGATAASVFEALEAARVAVAQADGGRRTRVSLVPRSRSVRLSGSSVLVLIEPSQAAPRGSLSRFKRVATGYFIEKRCRFLSYSKARNLWQAVVGGQGVAISANGGKPVKAALREARSTAGRTTCDAWAARLVRSAYATLAAN